MEHSVIFSFSQYPACLTLYCETVCGAALPQEEYTHTINNCKNLDSQN